MVTNCVMQLSGSDEFGFPLHAKNCAAGRSLSGMQFREKLYESLGLEAVSSYVV